MSMISNYRKSIVAFVVQYTPLTGLQQGPAAGRAVMELILDGGDYQTLDLQRFSFERILMDQKAEEINIV